MFRDRRDAGRRLADALQHLRGQNNIVLGLPRGGVVTAAEVARGLSAPLGVLFVRKIGHPDSPQLAIGAMAEDDDPVYDPKDTNGVDGEWLKLEEEAGREVIDYRREVYYDNMLTAPKLDNKTVILVDDGIATGLTIIAAIENVKKRGAAKVVVAVPVGPKQSIDRLKMLVDELVVLDSPDNFMGSVSAYYRHFEHVDDLEVRKLLIEN